MVCVAQHQTLQQNARSVDSLKNIVASSVGNEKGEALYFLSFAYIFSDLKQAKIAASEGVNLGLTLKDTAVIVSNGRILASAYRRLEIIDSALLLYDQLIPLARRAKLDDDLKILLNSAALTLTMTADYDEALALYFESLKMRQDAGDSAGIATTLHNIGHLYYCLDDIESAATFTNQSASIKEKIHFYHDLEAGYANLILFAAMKNDLAAMTKSLAKVDSLCGTSCDSLTMASIFYSQGRYHLNNGNLLTAKSFFERGYDISKKINSTKFLLNHGVALAQVLNEQNNFKNAIEVLKEAEALAIEKEFLNSEWIDLFLTLSNSYKHTSDLANAFLYQEKYLKRKDRVFNLRRTRNLMRLEAEFRERENIQILKLQQQKLAAEAATVKKQEIIGMLLIVILLVTLAASVILYKLVKVKARLNNQLTTKISQRTNELQKSYDTLRAYQMQQSMILKTATAELRANTASILGLLTLDQTDKICFLKDSLSKIEDIASRIDRENEKV